MKTFLTAHFLRGTLAAALCISGSAQAASLSQFSNMFRSVKSSPLALTSVKNQSFTRAHPVLTYGTFGLATTVAILAGIEGWRAYRKGEGFVSLVRKDFVKARKFLYAKKEDLVEVREKIASVDKQITDYEAMTGYVVESVRPALVKLRAEREELVKEKTTQVKRLGFWAEMEERQLELESDPLTKHMKAFSGWVVSLSRMNDLAVRVSWEPNDQALEEMLLLSPEVIRDLESMLASWNHVVAESKRFKSFYSESEQKKLTQYYSGFRAALQDLRSDEPNMRAYLRVAKQVGEAKAEIALLEKNKAKVVELQNVLKAKDEQITLMRRDLASLQQENMLMSSLSAATSGSAAPTSSSSASMLSPQSTTSSATVVAPVAPAVKPVQPLSLPVLVPPAAQALAEQNIRSEIVGLEKRAAPLRQEHDQLMERIEELGRKEKKRLDLLKTQIGQIEQFLTKARRRLTEISTAETVKAE